MVAWLAWGAPEYKLHADQWIPTPVSEVFPFFQNPANLERITPKWLGFRVESMTPDRIQSGTLITYKLYWLGIPYRWRTEILDWEPNRRFTDTQLNGPYILWHHTHTFSESAGGTLMSDDIRYRLPFGPFGALARTLIVRRQLQEIFDYRTKVIADLFSEGQIHMGPPQPNLKSKI